MQKKSMNYTAATTKGQIISELNCSVLNFPKNNEIIVRISALSTKMGQIRKIKAHYHKKNLFTI
jgi:hypothetical protein